jgi:hypothetical protein
MATTDLKLEEPGSLPRPGPIGRVVRLGFGSVCLWYVYSLIQLSGNLFGSDDHIKSTVWNGVVIGLFLVSYVVNIGFSRAWQKWPAIMSGAVFILLAGVGYLTQGRIETSLLALVIWGWEFYLFSHLGLAFLVSGIIGSAGCEMRAFHEPLHSIDQWEANRIQH